MIITVTDNLKTVYHTVTSFYADEINNDDMLITLHFLNGQTLNQMIKNPSTTIKIEQEE